ncbi:MAG: helix-turn-helix transcriptional regulator [Desulfovermiculus sp.]
MTTLLSTKEVASLLGIHEKNVYKLITDKGLPATKVTGKWLFPRHLVQQWIENNTINYPVQKSLALSTPALFVVAGSNDILLDRTLSLFMRQFPTYTAVFGNLGSMGGIKTLRQGLCHMATSHMAEEKAQDFNFGPAAAILEDMPAVVNFCQRKQGLIVDRGNPHHISSIQDLARKNLRLVNRSLNTGTRHWLDRALAEQGLFPSEIKGYDREVSRHLEVGLDVLAGRADCGPGIHSVAGLLGLDFIPMHWERFDLLISKERFFESNIQDFLHTLSSPEFIDLSADLMGYDLTLSGKIIHPPE